MTDFVVETVTRQIGDEPMTFYVCDEIYFDTFESARKYQQHRVGIKAVWDSARANSSKRKSWVEKVNWYRVAGLSVVMAGAASSVTLLISAWLILT